MRTFYVTGQFGFLHDVPVTLIGKTDPSCPTQGSLTYLTLLNSKIIGQISLKPKQP